MVRPTQLTHSQRAPARLLSAATVLLLRDGPNGLEVLMTRRAMSASFAPGAYVFPGGGIDATDAQAHAQARRRTTQPDAHLTQAIAAEGAAKKAVAAAQAALTEAIIHRQKCERAAQVQADAKVEAAARELAKVAPGPTLRLIQLERRGWAYSRKILGVSIEEIVSPTIFLGRFAEIDGDTARWSEQRRVSCVGSGLSRDQISAWIGFWPALGWKPWPAAHRCWPQGVADQCVSLPLGMATQK